MLACAVGSYLTAAYTVDRSNETVTNVEQDVWQGSTSKKNDVKITSCASNTAGTAIAYTVTNSSTTVRSYMIQFGVLDVLNARIGEVYGVVDNLAPGQTTQNKIMSTGTLTSKNCEIMRVG
jgi:hypothetical protein